MGELAAQSRGQFNSRNLLLAHDLRANAFCVCRQGNPLHTSHQVRGRLFPDHAR
jgi:hypothetical protein